MCSASGLREGVWRAYVTWSCGDWRREGSVSRMDSRRDCQINSHHGRTLCRLPDTSKSSHKDKGPRRLIICHNGGPPVLKDVGSYVQNVAVAMRVGIKMNQWLSAILS